MTAREEFVAALSAIRRCAAFRPKPQTVGLLLDPAHAAELTIESEDTAHGLGLGRVDDERALVGVIAKRDIAAHPHALSSRRRSCRGCVHRSPRARTGQRTTAH